RVFASGRRYSPETRSGSRSSGESRTSTNAVAAGAGRASERTIAALSGAPWAHVDAAIAAGSSAAGQRHPGRVRRAGGVGLDLLFVDMPEIVEVEPVVGRLPRMMLQPRGITPDERGDHGVALAAPGLDRFAEVLERERIAVAAAV